MEHRSNPVAAGPRLYGFPAPSRIWTGSRTALHDPRWPGIAAALAALREKKRYAVRIVDADCGTGCLLLQAVRHARALGFTAIEARGIDGSPSLTGRARAAAARLHDPAIGVVFELADMRTALREEHDSPADIVIWHGANGADGREDIVEALHRAGDLVISDGQAHFAERAAA